MITPPMGVGELDRVASLKGHGVFLIARDAEVLHCSPFASEGIASGHWPLTIEDGYLKMNDVAAQSAFISHLEDVIDGSIPVCGLSLDRGSHRLSMFLSISETKLDSAALVTARDPEWYAEDDSSRLQQLFGLTRREGELASYLSRGKTLAQFAEAHFLTVNTVKSHLKQVFKKVSVQSQMQLVAVVLAALR